MLRNIARTTRQASLTRRAHPGRKPSSLKHAFSPCARPPGLPDRLIASRHTLASRAIHGRRHHSRISQTGYNAPGEKRAQVLPAQHQILAGGVGQGAHAEAADTALQHASLTGLVRINESVHGSQIAWPQQIEEARLYGRTWRYVILVDSSAGGRILAQPVRNFFRARSSTDLRTLCLPDDENAPYGTKSDEAPRELVYRTLRHASRQGAEVIVMMCNTACPEKMKGRKQQIQAEAAAEGRKRVVHSMDLIETTVRATIERGGTERREQAGEPETACRGASHAAGTSRRSTRIGCIARNPAEQLPLLF